MFVHASRIQNQLEYLRRRGVDISPLRREINIPEGTTFGPDSRYDFEQYKRVLDFALRQTNDLDYGLSFGNQPQLGGTVGMMGASCKNLKESFIQGTKFLKLQGDFALLEFIDHPTEPKLVYTPVESWVLESPDTAKLEVDVMFSFINTILRVNSNHNLRIKGLRLNCKKPKDIQKYVEVFGVVPEFDTDSNEIFFDPASLMIPMKAFNPESFQLLHDYLKGRLEHLSRSEKISDKVKQVLHSSFKYQFPDIGSVADKLNLSARSLQRKLSEEQTTFKDLLQETRFGIAKQLLLQDYMTVSEIGYILGYSDLGNFSRSFKKYEGVSPVEFRGKG